MKVKIKQSILTSKKYDIRVRNAFGKKIKRRSVKTPSIVGKRPKSPYAKLQKKKIYTPSNLVFPYNVKELVLHLDDIKNFKDNYKLGIDHSKIEIIDNASILLLTAGLNNIFNGKKLIKNKKLAPKMKINEDYLS